ncbi:dipeptidase [Thalassobius sp. I31.1]|uniref:dipeptidase n=1 Tax=Thalassobius sp. I31.1 TaxID=2109912 RepID=UPI000D19A9F1|nr:dipeptidase [Thalassobius sp. I31.1]
MVQQDPQLIFDGHSDVLLKLNGMVPAKGDVRDAVARFVQGCSGHIDVPRSEAGGFAGGFFAIYVPSEDPGGDIFSEMLKPAYNLPLPQALEYRNALPVALTQAGILIEMERQGAVKICRSVTDIRATVSSGRIASVMHMEGTEAIDADLVALDVFYAAGLRSLGPVWSRPTIFAEGVPFAYPSDGDIGEGLTPAGKALIRKCNALGVMVDLSHLNEKGFWDVADISDAPLVATHSNAHAICPHARNLTDKQLQAIGESKGMVGLNFATAFLRPDGKMLPETPVTDMLMHLDHMIGICGEDHVGLGSDFDGATVPVSIQDVAGLPVLVQAMRDHGYNDDLIHKLCFENWMQVLERTWKGD